MADPEIYLYIDDASGRDPNRREPEQDIAAELVGIEADQVHE
jgi:hypothetical protein